MTVRSWSYLSPCCGKVSFCSFCCHITVYYRLVGQQALGPSLLFAAYLAKGVLGLQMCNPSPLTPFYSLWVFCLHVCVCTVCPQRSDESIRFPGTGVTDSCELPCGCWESNPGPLQEQSVRVTTENSLKSSHPAFYVGSTLELG